MISLILVARFVGATNQGLTNCPSAARVFHLQTTLEVDLPVSHSLEDEDYFEKEQLLGEHDRSPIKC